MQKCIQMESGGVRLELSSGAVLICDAVLVAAGRQSKTANLGLEKAGLRTGERGIIPMNEHFQTNIENIYAAGDRIWGELKTRTAGHPAGGWLLVVAGGAATLQSFWPGLRKWMRTVCPLIGVVKFWIRLINTTNRPECR